MTTNTLEKLFLIDANSLIHRCFHALPPLTAAGGKPIQAIYGIASVLLKLWKEDNPHYAVALFDRPEPTFRKKAYEDYKAHRPKAPDDLISQIIEAHNLFSAFGIKTFEEPGFEADDLIATLATRFAGEENVQVIVLTGDLDTLQLVEGNKVVVRTFKKGLSETITYDKDAVEARYGIAPDQITDYKALVGDPSDNIKGVPGIGPKTASRLIAQYGSIKKLYERIDDEPKLKKKLIEYKTHAEAAMGLVVLRRDMSVSVTSLKELRIAKSQEKVIRYFDTMGFKTLKKRLSEIDVSPAGLYD